MYCNCILFREIATVTTKVKQNSSTFSAQNQWIRENLLDAHVLFHSDVCRQCLHKQQVIKQSQAQKETLNQVSLNGGNLTRTQTQSRLTFHMNWPSSHLIMQNKA